jgi:hypothetical protein
MWKQYPYHSLTVNGILADYRPQQTYSTQIFLIGIAIVIYDTFCWVSVQN